MIVTGYFDCKFEITPAGDQLLGVIITIHIEKHTQNFLKSEAFKNTI